MRGIGNAGGFKMMVQDKRGRGLPALEAATQEMVAAANQTPGLTGIFSLFNTRTPKVYADIDRVRAEMLNVSPDLSPDGHWNYPTSRERKRKQPRTVAPLL